MSSSLAHAAATDLSQYSADARVQRLPRSRRQLLANEKAPATTSQLGQTSGVAPWDARCEQVELQWNRGAPAPPSA